jgi:hypothetical protein
MSPLERLLSREIEFHRRLRQEAPGTADVDDLHTSYALQSGYEPLLQQLGRVTAQDIDLLAERYQLAGDARDVLAARDFLTRLPCLGRYES